MNNKNTDIKIGINKFKAIGQVVVSLVLILIMIFLLIMVNEKMYGINRSICFITILLSLLLHLKFLLIGINMIRCLSKGLIISEQGVIVNFGPTKKQIIEWDEIDHVKSDKDAKVKYILLVLKDYDSFIIKLKASYKYFFGRNKIVRQKGINVYSDWLDYKFDDLKEIIGSNLKKTE